MLWFLLGASQKITRSWTILFQNVLLFLLVSRFIFYFFIGVSNVPVRLIAEALFIRISIPPKVDTASSTDLRTVFSSRISTIQGKHLPPASSTKLRLKKC